MAQISKLLFARPSRPGLPAHLSTLLGGVARLHEIASLEEMAWSSRRSPGKIDLMAKKTLIGVVHLAALPGSPQFSDRETVRRAALRDAESLVSAGFDGVIVENFGDAPFRKGAVDAITLTEMTRLAGSIREVLPARMQLGINVLRNDARGAVAIAGACKADFVRVNVHTGVVHADQGTIEGRADETLRLRRDWSVEARIHADVAVKHALLLPGFDLEQAAKDCAYRGRADGLIVTGQGTGAATSLGEVRRVKLAVPDRPVWIGSGVTEHSIAESLSVADGVIVGTAIKVDGQVQAPVSSERALRLVEKARTC